jgi:2-polyprenyl-3-methyl-5-hydroxy-6-metoxy-1,4-benzoquinol methylase
MVADSGWKRYVNAAGLAYARLLAGREYKKQSFVWVNERPIEYGFLLSALAASSAVTVLDVGVGQSALPALLRSCGYLVTATDNMTDYWPRGLTNRHYHVVDDDITRTSLRQTFDFISCISALEHIEDFDAAVASMYRLLKPGAGLVVTFPYNESEFIEDVHRLPGAGYGMDAPYICRVFSRAEVNRWVEAHDWRIAAQEYWRVFSGEYWTFGKWLRPPVESGPDEPHHLTCLLFEKQGPCSAALKS